MNRIPVLYLDIRSRQEYCSGHIPTAILVETKNVPETISEYASLKHKLLQATKRVPRHVQIFVYCKRGFRAREAARILKKLGFMNVTNIGGVDTEPLKNYMLVKGLGTTSC